MAKQFLRQVVEQARVKSWTSDEHFTSMAHCWKPEPG